MLMWMHDILILLGGIAISFSLFYSWFLIKQQRLTQLYYLYVLRFVAILFFILIYAAAFLLLTKKNIGYDQLIDLISLFLFFSGFFVLIESYFKKRLLDYSETSNKALASANVNMAFLYAQLDELKNNLEQQKDELQEAYKHLQDTQAQMIQLEKMAALGHLVAGIAHEINTPIGAINASGASISDFLENKFQQAIQFLRDLSPEKLGIFNRLVASFLSSPGPLTSKEERRVRKKLEALLDEEGINDSDEIAHLLVEMRIYDNLEALLPLLKIENCLDLLNNTVNFLRIYENSKTIQLSSQKIKKIVFSLKSYAHFGERTEITKFNLKQNIDNIITLYTNTMKYNVELIYHYDDTIPDINGNPDELGQVWTNLISNSLQAMGYQGTLEIDVRQDADNVIVKVTDTGGGIPEEIEDKIFLPFFTTKAAGEGSGLGLHIVKQILDKHRATISVSSDPGKTVFTVKLPKKLASFLEFP